MYRRPRVVVRGFGVKMKRLTQVRAALKQELKWLDAEHDGKNNWNSAFVAGLLEPAVCRWLYERLAARGRNVDPVVRTSWGLAWPSMIVGSSV